MAALLIKNTRSATRALGQNQQEGRRYLYDVLEVGEANDDMKLHGGILRTGDEQSLALPREGANFLKARGYSTKENRVTIKPEVSQV